MKDNCFIKQNHRNIKVSFITVSILLFGITLLFVYRFKNMCFESFTIFGLTILLFVFLEKLLNSFGVYVLNGKIYYKTIIKKEIDPNTIVGIKIIKSEATVNPVWSPIMLKDKNGNVMYSAIYLTEIRENMRNYPHGDLSFIIVYREDIAMYSIYDEEFIRYLKTKNDKIEIL